MPNDAIPLPQKNFTARCNCGLNGNSGFCSNLIGTTKYKDAVASLKSVLEVSQCHTLDRNDFRAQRDSCGIGPSSTLDEAITAMFEVKYHAYVQDPTVSGCIEQIFDDSLFNQQKMFALVNTLSAVTLSIALAFSTLL